MSRLTMQFQNSSRHFFITPIKQLDGSMKAVLSAQSLSEQSYQVNQPWRGDLSIGTEEDSSQTAHPICRQDKCTNAGAIFLLMCICMNPKLLSNKMRLNLWQKAIEFLIPAFGIQDSQELQKQIGSYALAVTRDSSIFKKADYLLPPDFVVDAVMRGQEDIVLNILRADPKYLLKKAKVKNCVDVEYEVTPLEAAVMTTDIEMIEHIKPFFRALENDLNENAIDGLSEFYRQIKAAFQKSMQRYYEIQKERVILLKAQLPVDCNALEKAQERLLIYRNAIDTNDFIDILKVHEQAQKDNAFDCRPYVDAIIKASKKEIDAVIDLIDAKTPEDISIANEQGFSFVETGFTDRQGNAYSREMVQALPLDQLTLVQVLNRFRENFFKHKQQQYIENPEDMLALLRVRKLLPGLVYQNSRDGMFSRISAIVWSQFVGFAQRVVAETVKQDIREGICYVVTKQYSYAKEKCHNRTRAAKFNALRSDNDYHDYMVRNTAIDISLSSRPVLAGIGFQYAVSYTDHEYHSDGPIICSNQRENSADEVFLKYISQKKYFWEDLAFGESYEQLRQSF